MIICGDHGVRYYGPTKDASAKRKLEMLPIRFVMIRGNHDQRPSLKSCVPIHVQNGDAIAGDFLVEYEFPSILYTAEYGWYTFAKHPTFVIGGAYSIDKPYRLEQQELGNKRWRWFHDEQLNASERCAAYAAFKNRIENMAAEEVGNVWIMSHTCPLRYRPGGSLIPGIDRSREDLTMEKWMNDIDDIVCAVGDEHGLTNGTGPYGKWFCGHFHTDQLLFKMRFLYHDIIELTE